MKIVLVGPRLPKSDNHWDELNQFYSKLHNTLSIEKIEIFNVDNSLYQLNKNEREKEIVTKIRNCDMVVAYINHNSHSDPGIVVGLAHAYLKPTVIIYDDKSITEGIANILSNIVSRIQFDNYDDAILKIKNLIKSIRIRQSQVTKPKRNRRKSKLTK